MTEEQINELLKSISDIQSSVVETAGRQVENQIVLQDIRNELTTVSNVNFSILCLLALFLGSFIGVRLLGTVKKIWSGGKK